MLNLLPFDCLQPIGKQAMIETHQLSYLSSGRRLVDAKEAVTASANRNVIVVAAPDYGTQSEDPSERPAGRFDGLEWTPLPGTDSEAQAIMAMMKGASLLTGKAASESALEAVRAPHILHLATHGFFLGSQTGGIDSASRGLTITGIEPKGELVEALEQMENPLLLSGLVLAGANRQGTEQDDGYMTALEMSGLDLQGTELVVMSACETGIGTVTAGAGVFGLRRAVALAGAKSQVMSLWKVSDDATTELMRVFYQGLTSGLSRTDALRKAQRSLSATDKWNHPYFWSAFILSGDWREL
ncbi:MAG: CHAT domain-containing protein [Planctomycetota bacterium]|jgi:CHAT domain-containing protein